MEDRLYVDNLLRERACALCGADRRARRTPEANACAVCDSAMPAEDARFAIARTGASAVCSVACLEAALNDVPRGDRTCPACGSPWGETALAARTCGICGTVLSLEEGFAGLWRGGRIRTFCGATCLEAYLRRANPFCG